MRVLFSVAFGFFLLGLMLGGFEEPREERASRDGFEAVEQHKKGGDTLAQAIII